MFDINKKRQFNKATVKEVIQELEKLNPEAEFCVIGDERFFIHVETDGTVVTLDTEEMTDEYEITKLKNELESIVVSFDSIQETVTFQKKQRIVILHW